MALLEICAAVKLLNDPPAQLNAALRGHSPLRGYKEWQERANLLN